MIRKRRNQKEIPTLKTEVGKTNLTIRYLHVYLEKFIDNVTESARCMPGMHGLVVAHSSYLVGGNKGKQRTYNSNRIR